MDKRLLSLLLLSFAIGLFWLVPTQARADFIIKFTDRGQVTVHRYMEEGQTIKIYTPQGVIGFRRKDVEQIIAVDTSHSMSTPLETVSATLAPLGQESVSVPLGGQKTTDGDKATKTEGGSTAGASGAAATAAERIDDQYQEVEQEFTKLWEKHVQDVDSGASEEVLAENRQKLNQLSNERHKVIDDARRATPDDLPTWAQ